MVWLWFNCSLRLRSNSLFNKTNKHWIVVVKGKGKWKKGNAAPFLSFTNANDWSKSLFKINTWIINGPLYVYLRRFCTNITLQMENLANPFWKLDWNDLFSDGLNITRPIAALCVERGGSNRRGLVVIKVKSYQCDAFVVINWLRHQWRNLIGPYWVWLRESHLNFAYGLFPRWICETFQSSNK